MNKPAWLSSFPLLQGNKAYRNFWTGQSLSYLGNSMYDIGVIWLVFSKTGSSLQVALVIVVSFMTEMLFGLFLGEMADRKDPKRLMQTTDLMQGIVLLLLSIAFLLHHFQIWMIYVVTACLSLASLLFSNARSKWMVDIVSSEQLLSANSFLSVSKQVTRLLGSSLGGLLVIKAGATMGVLVNSISFFASMIFLWITPSPTNRQEDQTAAPSFSSRIERIKGGLKWLGGQPIMMLVIVIGTLSNVALAPTNVLPPLYIQHDLAAHADALGYFDAAIGFGLLVGGLVTGILSPKRYGIWFLSGLLLEGVAMVSLAGAPSLMIAYAANFLLGLGVMVAALPLGTMIQILTPRDMLGRVNSLFSMGLNLAIPLSFGGVGGVAQWLGARTLYAYGGVLMLVCCIVGMIPSRLRQASLSTGNKEENQTLSSTSV